MEQLAPRDRSAWRAVVAVCLVASLLGTGCAARQTARATHPSNSLDETTESTSIARSASSPRRHSHSALASTPAASSAARSTASANSVRWASHESTAESPTAPASEATTQQVSRAALPINLPTALRLADVNAVDVAAATERIQAASAALDLANVLWLPSLTIGGDYNRHDGQTQDAAGNVISNSRSSGMVGLGTGMLNAGIINVGDAIFAPLAARQHVQAREADRQAASNDAMLAVSEAYFNMQQARGEFAGAAEASRRTQELIDHTKKLAPALIPELEILRGEAELARRRQAELLAEERRKVASAELIRVLRLDPSSEVEPEEPPHLRVDLIDLNRPVDELIPIGLTHRPELASKQAQVQATLTLLKQEKLRPLIPSVLLRGFSTPVTGTLGFGYFGGGQNGSFGNGGLRNDFDLQLLWQLDNLGFGNKAKTRQRDSENRQAIIELFKLQDKVAAETSQAYAQAQLAKKRVEIAESGLKAAVESADKNLLALEETKGVGAMQVLLVRPQEVLAAIQSLSQGYADYFAAVADANRAQFRLYRALGQPAECLSPSQMMKGELANSNAEQRNAGDDIQ